MAADLLADLGVSGEDVGVLNHGLVGGVLWPDLQHAPPLGELGAVFLVLGTTLRKTVKTWWYASIVIISNIHIHTNKVKAKQKKYCHRSLVLPLLFKKNIFIIQKYIYYSFSHCLYK